ncbi:uncharacterized protein ARMOST_06629 [Armillaria ostoyae]|uniref:Uncharacterized protein n=1 Tax=Armillaria ostoyae TaxID=47428 RepID=A0A284R3I9_ARMOS|nr:uncharacterized protein ARMOST_06629 [Armillaria ostoyae]
MKRPPGLMMLHICGFGEEAARCGWVPANWTSLQTMPRISFEQLTIYWNSLRFCHQLTTCDCTIQRYWRPYGVLLRAAARWDELVCVPLLFISLGASARTPIALSTAGSRGQPLRSVLYHNVSLLYDFYSTSTPQSRQTMSICRVSLGPCAGNSTNTNTTSMSVQILVTRCRHVRILVPWHLPPTSISPSILTSPFKTIDPIPEASSILDLLLAAHKYRVYAAISSCKNALRPMIPAHSLPILSMALRWKDRLLIDEAAERAVAPLYSRWTLCVWRFGPYTIALG